MGAIGMDTNKLLNIVTNYRNFDEDLRTSNKSDILYDWRIKLNLLFPKNKEIMMKDFCKVSQLDFGCDCIVIDDKGRKHSIDFKTRNFKYYKNDIYLLELCHHIYSDRSCKTKLKTESGWLYKSTADIILYGTLNESKNEIIELCGFSLIPFKEKYFSNEITLNKMGDGFGYTLFNNGYYQTTVNAKVHILFLKNNAIENKFWYFTLIGDKFDK